LEKAIDSKPKQIPKDTPNIFLTGATGFLVIQKNFGD
jgi:hypothetical protein